MQVIFASHHCCVRVIKEGLALIKAGVDVKFLQHQFSNEAFINLVPECSFYRDVNEYAFKLAHLCRNADLIHVHNEPDWLGHIAVDVVKGEIPVVFDAHDLNSIRRGEVYEDERKSLDVCDAFIFPSKPYMDMTVERYALTKPCDVIYSMCNDNVLEFEALPRVNGIVYEGGIVGENQGDAFEYRNYMPLARELTKQGIPLFLYGLDPELQTEYGNAGAVPMGRLGYFTLLKQLSRFDWGFLGSCVPHIQWETAMPNKLFEYMAAGIPVLAFNAGESAKFIREHNVGIVLDSMEQIGDIYSKHAEYRQIVAEKRHLWTMESQTEKILALYKEVLKKR